MPMNGVVSHVLARGHAHRGQEGVDGGIDLGEARIAIVWDSSSAHWMLREARS